MTPTCPETMPVALSQATFFADTLCTLAGGLEENVGPHSASALISDIGTAMGEAICAEYSAHAGPTPWPPHLIAEVLVDLKRRIGGAFRIESLTHDTLVLTNTHCPFADRVRGRESLCMMTTNVFGTIVARSTGYAAVDIPEALARGDCRCRVVIRLKKDADADGYEFFAAAD